jgi:hypothetical protein
MEALPSPTVRALLVLPVQAHGLDQEGPVLRGLDDTDQSCCAKKLGGAKGFVG